MKIDPPMGSFTLHKNSSKPAVFLAGGIGIITPFLSIVRQADHDRLPHKLQLFCSNRRPEDTPFLDALQVFEKSNPNFQLVCTMTQMPQSKKEWKGETACILDESKCAPLLNWPAVKLNALNGKLRSAGQLSGTGTITSNPRRDIDYHQARRHHLVTDIGVAANLYVEMLVGRGL